MKIAQIMPSQDGGGEGSPTALRRVLSYLTEELVRRGHQVGLFIGAGPQGRARDRFQILHFHVGSRTPLEAPRRGGPPVVVTRFETGDGALFSSRPCGVPLVTVSGAPPFREPSRARAEAISYGLPETAYRLGNGRGGHLVAIGAMRPGGGLDRAIEIARRSGRRIRVMASSGEVDEDYVASNIEPLLVDPHVMFVQDRDPASGADFLRDPIALLLPGAGPYGLTVIEALACGTPVIAFRGQLAEELIDPGVTGFFVSSLCEAVEAVARVPGIDRRRCREAFERRFTAARMAEDYLSLYRELLEGRRRGRPRLRSSDVAGRGAQAGPGEDFGSESAVLVLDPAEDEADGE